jgi:DNA-binding LacI/PurR family transcriptional regulator
VTHLLERGRRRIATITGPPDMGAGRDRLAGYRTALADAGLPDEPGLVEAGTFSELSGERAMRALLARHEDLDAVFAANDSMAVGALRVLRDTGRTVPDDVAVVGFDDSPLSRVTEPLLSTVRQPVDGMGRAMAEMLLGLIAGGDGDVRHRGVLPTELVVRGSS